MAREATKEQVIIVRLMSMMPYGGLIQNHMPRAADVTLGTVATWLGALKQALDDIVKRRQEDKRAARYDTLVGALRGILEDLRQDPD